MPMITPGLGAKIMSLRNQKGWSQIKLARELGYGVSGTVSQWENGWNDPSFDALSGINRLFGSDLALDPTQPSLRRLNGSAQDSREVTRDTAPPMNLRPTQSATYRADGTQLTDNILQTRLQREDRAHEPRFAEASKIAETLYSILNEPVMRRRIKELHRHNVRGQEIQNCFISEAEAIGFRSEARGLFADYEVPLLRPDYYLPLSGGSSGIILEVEKGRTTNNNMDVLDFWKCHICEHAEFLFLVVPAYRMNEDNTTGRNEFGAVQRRLGTFFKRRNYTNVAAVWLFGY